MTKMVHATRIGVVEILTVFVDEHPSMLTADRLGLLELLRHARTPDEDGERFYGTAVNAMLKQGVIDDSQLAEVISKVLAAEKAVEF